MLALSLLSEGGKSPDTSLMFLFLIVIAFFFLMITAGWLTSNGKQDQTETAHEAKKSTKKNVNERVKGGRKSK